MALKFLYKSKESRGSFRRFEDCRSRSPSSRVHDFTEGGRINSKQDIEFPHGTEIGLHVLFGIAANAPFRAGSSSWFGNSSHSVSMNQKLGRLSLAGNLNQCKALSTLTGDQILGRKKMHISYPVQRRIVKALRKGERTIASNLLQKLGQMKCSLQADDFDHILYYCARRPDPLFAMETWRLLDERKIRMNNNFCTCMVQALCKGGYLEEVLNLLNYLGENHNLYPTLDIYNRFLAACVKLKNTVYASKCLALMERRLVGKNELTYLALLKLAFLEEDRFVVLQIWKDYIRHYQANIPLLRYFIMSFSKLRDREIANDVLQLLVTCALRGAAFGVKMDKGRLSFPKLDIPIPSINGLSSRGWGSGNINPYSEEVNGPGRGIESTFLLTGRNAIGYGSVYPIVKILRCAFNDLIHACTKARDCDSAEQLFQQMLDLGLEPSQQTYDGLIRSVVYGNGFASGMKLLKTMRMRNLEPRISTLAILSSGCSEALQLDLAETLLDQLSECPYPYPYNALLKACTVVNEPERGIRVLAKLKQSKAKPDIKTYELLLCLFGNVNPPYEKGNMLSQSVVAERIKAIEADMTKNSVQHSSKSIRNLLRALGYEGMIKELIRYLRLAEDLFSRNNMWLGTPVYNTVLYALTASDKNLMAIDMFKSMRRCGLRLNDVTYNTMIACCGNIHCFRSATALVSTMIRDGYLPHTMTYTALVKILLDDKNYDEALYLLDRACSDCGELDVLLFNTVLKKAGQMGSIDVIEFILEQMRQANIGPDPSTCSYVCASYTDLLCDRTAVEALEVLSVRMITHEGFPTAEKRAEYEDFIFSEDPEAESKIFHLFEGYRDNIAFGLLNLRRCAILGFMDSVEWSPDGSPWSRRLSANYDDLIELKCKGMGDICWKKSKVIDSPIPMRKMDHVSA